MYSTEQIAVRRAVKCRTLEALCDMAIIGKVGERTLMGNEPLDLTTRLTLYWLSVRDDEAATVTLRTAKGCTSRPAGAENQDSILLEFLQDHAEGARSGSCGQGFARDCALWAAQLADRNRGNVRLSDIWRIRSADIGRARKAARQEFREFYKKPNQDPRTAQEAKYYLVWSRHLDGMTEDSYEPLVASLGKRFPEDGIDKFTWDAAFKIKPSEYALKDEDG
jgi:hypothetical protein